MKTKVIALLLLAAMVFSAFVPAVFSAEPSDDPTEVASVEDDVIEEYPEPQMRQGTSKRDSGKRFAPTTDGWSYERRVYAAVETMLIEAIRAGETTLDLSAYNYDSNKIKLSNIIYYSPYLENAVNISAWVFRDTGIYSRFDITYVMSMGEIRDYYARLDRKAAQIEALLATASADADKALLLHDYLVYNCEYDYDNYLSNTVPNESYQISGLLLKGVGVCQAYAITFRYFMDRAGIESYVVESGYMNHAWNVIKIGGSYYHTDVTWDDPVYDRLGLVKHDYFLLSDSAISKSRSGDSVHYGWDMPDGTCSSTLYDNAYWCGVNSPICLSGRDRYYITGRKIVRRDGASGAEYTLKELNSWPTWEGTGHWGYNHSGLWLDEGKLYYNTATELRRVDCSTLADQTVYTPDTSSGYIFGSAVKNDEFYYILKQHPDDRGTLCSVPYHTVTDKETVCLDCPYVMLRVGQTAKLNATVLHAYSTVHWKSSDPSVASVSADGTVTANHEGAAAITASTESGASDTCIVYVTAADSNIISGSCGADMTWKLDTDTGVLMISGTGIMADYTNTYNAPWYRYHGEIKTVYISEGVTNISGCAFIDCSEMVSITIPSGVTRIEFRAFMNCSGLRDVFYNGSADGWNAISIGSKNEYLTGANIHCTGHSHSYTAVVTAPTCTEQGFTTYSCSCGSSYKDTYVAALGHKYVNGVCTHCGAKDPNYKPAEPIIFNDVPEKAWYAEAVNYAVKNKLMDGVGNGKFAPDSPMTRAMLVTVLWRYEGSPKEGTNGFSDVPNGKWYTDAVAWASENGIVGGVGNNKFDPNGNITREQMVAILYRYAQKKGFDTSERGDLSSFPDRAKVSSYAKDAIAWAVGEGILNGSGGKLLPQGNATRAQVSAILMRYIEGIAKK